MSIVAKKWIGRRKSVRYRRKNSRTELDKKVRKAKLGRDNVTVIMGNAMRREDGA